MIEKWAWRARAVAAAIVLAASALPAVSSGLISGFAEVIDGDGLKIGPIVLRLHGIDAPEMGQRCAAPGGRTWPCDQAAAERLAKLVADKELNCEPLDRDLYGRIIARCWAGDVDLGATMVEEGLSWAFTRYSDDYVAHEGAARAAGLGIWQADTQPAWEYRADRWARAAEASPREGCPIKGNINRDGERIYHTPWSPWYDRTIVDESKGQRWFCSEAEAIEAGWRAPRR